MKIKMLILRMRFVLLPISALFMLAVAASHRTPPPQFYLPDDLEVTLWAESPMFFNPTNIDTDHRGRIWVAEAVNYRNYLNDSTVVKHHSQGDRIVILEDTDKDGRADKSVVFVQDTDLVSPLGIAVIGRQVIVSCSPKLIVYTDENGDDRPDKKEVLLHGFGGIDHDHGLHAVVAGPDGRWYFNVGNAGPHQVNDRSGWTLHSGSAYNDGAPEGIENRGGLVSADGKVWTGGLQLRIDPDGKGLSVLGHNFRNSYESCIDSYGDLWQNDNDDQTASCRTSWLPEGGNAGYFNQDGTRFWYADQRPGQDMPTAHWHQEDPGVMPAGDIYGAGAPTGITVNESDALGEQYLGMLLSADAGRNAVFSYIPQASGSGFRLEGTRKTLIASTPKDDPGYVWADPLKQRDTSKWFRPSDILVGADGALYIADWYDPVVGAHQLKDREGIGRIYRVAPKGKKLSVPKTDLSSVEGQIEALKSPAVNVRLLGFEILKAGGEKSVPAVSALLQAPNPYHRARAVHLLPQLGPQGRQVVEDLLANPAAEPRLRVAAFKGLCLQFDTEKKQDLCRRILPLANAALRREIAVTSAGFALPDRQEILLQIVEKYDSDDPWLLDAIGICAGNDAETLWPEILSRIKTLPVWQHAGLTLAWRLHPASAVGFLSELAQREELPTGDRRKAVTGLAFVQDKKAVEAMFSLAESKLPDVAEQARYWLAYRQTNDWSSLWNWKTTTVDVAKELKKAALKAAREKVLDENISLWDRKEALKTMALDSFGGQLLLDLACDNKLPRELDNDLAANIFSNPDLAVRARAGNCVKRPGTAVTLSPERIAGLQGNPAAGKTVFQTSCMACHKAEGAGTAIGPDLSAIGAKFDYPEMLDAIINPAAAIVFGYESWSIQTKNGDSFYGFLVSDGTAVVVRDLGGQQHSIPATTVLKKKKQGGSVMPDAVALGLSEQQLADLTSYLLTLK